MHPSTITVRSFAYKTIRGHRTCSVKSNLIPVQLCRVEYRSYTTPASQRTEEDFTGRKSDDDPQASSPHSTESGAPIADVESRELGQPEKPNGLQGSAKLLADALEEEEELFRSGKIKPRYVEQAEALAHESQAWTGDESVKDAVIRMLMDSSKPLRQEKIQTSESKIKDITKTLDFSPVISGTSTGSATGMSEPEAKPANLSAIIEAERTIPASEFKPWHAKYVAKDQVSASPSILYGQFINDADFSNVASLLDQPQILNDPKARKAIKKSMEGQKIRGRLTGAREGALDYRLGVEDGKAGEKYGQHRGSSAAGGSMRGAPSGMRAWNNLVEDRIERARSSGWFDNVPGRGQPINSDPDQHNPFIDSSEFFMNRIVKRQGARPPWIELIQELESAQTAFRESLLSSYVRAVVRSLLTSLYETQESLAELTAEKASDMRDKRWKDREGSYHQEAVRELNNTVRRMNTVAPPSARRGLISLDDELKLMYNQAGPLIVAELDKRKADGWDKKKPGEDYHDDEDEVGFGRGSKNAGDAGKTDWGFDMGGLDVMGAIRNLFRRQSK